MDKRAFLAVILSLIVLVLYQEWIARYYSDPVPPDPVEEQRAEEHRPATPPPASVAAPSPVPFSEHARDIRIETDEYIAVFTNVGGRLKSFRFKKYRASVDEKSPLFEIVPSAPGVPYPLGLRWQSHMVEDDSQLIYSVQGTNLNLTGESKGTLIFQGKTPIGTTVNKTFTFSGSHYRIGMDVSIRAADGRNLTPQVLLTETSDHAYVNPDAHFEGFIALVDKKVHRHGPADAVRGQELSGAIAWQGFGYTYFFFGLLPPEGGTEQAALGEVGSAFIATIAPQGPPKDVDSYTLFIGPKKIETLKELGRGLEKSIDFGWFGPVAIPFLHILHFLHGFTGSYGLDIILLTVFLKLLLAPLTHKSFVSMKQMQKLQPQMERIKEKFKDDREKLNKEIMEMYRRNGVNPLGGCLPMLVQLPVFIGLYSALSTPIELRHAPFLWIKDLSRPDWQSLPFTIGDWHLGFPVLTLLMGASMFVQQWMTPMAGDPNQRRIMLLMPVVFTFLFVSFPAGLTVYWLVNNILTIGQQYWIIRKE
jgi:YidC/Oxa1 family membrane protein insertase